MWQREQKPSRSEPDPLVVIQVFPMSNLDVQLSFANGLRCALLVPSGGAGTSQFPSVAVRRASKKNAALQAGSRQAFDIIDPFHSWKMRWWHWPQTRGFPAPEKYASYGGGRSRASLTLYGAASGIRFGSSPCLAA